MGRPRTPRLYNPRNLINEEIKIFVNEIFDELIPTKFDVVKSIKYGDFYYDQHIFSTNSGEKYEADFYKTMLNMQQLKNVSNYFQNILTVNCIDIGFTLFNNVNNDMHDYGFEGTLNDPYIKKTNKNEQYEVLGKVAYIVNEYMKSHKKQRIYAIGKNAYHSNLRVYQNMYEKLFKSFIKVEDVSDYYDDGAIYYIKQL